MFKAVFIKVCIVVSGAWMVFAATTPKDCKQVNDFMYNKCGENTGKKLVCCKPKEACVSAVQKSSTVYACSANRHLSGTKVVNVLIQPMLGIGLAIGAVVCMALKLDIKRNHTTKLCVAVIAFTWPLVLSSKWTYGWWAIFLALLVAYMVNSQGFSWYLYPATWALQVFQIIALFGSYEAFHVFLGNQGAFSSTALITALGGMTESSCSTHYGNYFTVEAIEKNATNADPNIDYDGLCTPEWLTTVMAMTVIQGILWMVTALVSASPLLSKGREGIKLGAITEMQTTAKES